ncbi:LysR family transcriptional regulator [Kaustia mangrovi]|uniref:LysR family transcriptional regulator n=1 Tax=Kaustia mangrovi TaxID=2593653 RepID=A0A7S8C1Q4_9HYPH|nr:LysR family transcriptional regulator [Kaustia mangrovi]QPC41770.1 LysR family transcriptional regulator [Kaustia mangrovi]
MEFRGLETFLWIARLGSFRAAARHLNTTQPSVSARISNLEEEFGVQLFERGGRRIALTPKGRELLDYAERLLALRGEMLEAVGNPEIVHGTIRLGVAETIVHTWLPVLLERLHHAYPAVSLELDVDTTINLRDKLVAHDIDIAFLMGPVSQPEIENAELCTYPLSWVASPALALPRGRLSVADLARYPIITYPRLTKPHIAIESMFAHAGGGRTCIHGCSSLSTIVQMAKVGLGIGAIPLEIVREELRRGELHVVDTDAALAPLSFTVSYQLKESAPLALAVTRLAQEIAGQWQAE